MHTFGSLVVDNHLVWWLLRNSLETEMRVSYVELTSHQWHDVDKPEKIMKLVGLDQGPFWKAQLKINFDDAIFHIKKFEMRNLFHEKKDGL